MADFDITDCIACSFLFAVPLVLLYIWQKPVKRAKKQVEELEFKSAEAKTQLLVAGKDPEKDNPFEEMLAQAKHTLRDEEHEYNQSANKMYLLILFFAIFALWKVIIRL